MLEFYCISYVVIFSVYILSDLGFWSNLIGSFIVSLLFAISEYHVLDNDENTTLVVIGRCPWSIRVQIHGWRHAKLAFFVSFNMARGFENVCGINSDKSKWNPRKKFHWSYLQERKMEKRGQKELLTTLECLNYKKSSQQLPSCFIAMRDSPFCKCFRHHSALSKKRRWKTFQRNCMQLR